MASSLENVKLGVCTITFDSVDLGYTKGGVTFEVTTETYTVVIDQFGETPVSNYITGRIAKVMTPLAETTIDNMKAIMPGSTLVVDGVTATKRKLVVSTGVGVNLINTAKKLVLRPLGLADASEDITIPRANTPGQVTFSYNTNQERIFNTEWFGYPDNAVGDSTLYIYGDETATA